MMEAEAEILDELIEGITSSAYGMPVRLMERVHAMGEAAVPALTQALVRGQDDETATRSGSSCCCLGKA